MSKARYLANVVTSTGAISSDVLSTVVDGAPSALNTLNEIAAAINDDPNYATTLTTALSGKVPTSTTLTINGVGHSLADHRSWTIDSLPSQSTHSGKYLTTDGTTATWSALSSGNVTTALGYTPVTNARTLTINGTSYDLTTNRSWTVDALPSQSTHSGKYLTTDGTSASWAAVSVTPTAVSDQANSSTGYFDLPVGTTAQRPASPGFGMIRFNTTINYIEYYDESAGSWIPISSPPSITSISPTSYNGEQGTVITINGILFSSGAVVKFITNSGTEYAASTTTFISSTQLTATTPQDFTVAQEPLSIKVENSSGLSATLSSALDCGGTPTWVTASGTLLTITEGSSVSTTVSATDPDSGATISYSISSGSLPSGVSLNSSTGAITGTAGLVASDTTYTFGITATDNAGNTSERSFNIVVQNIPDPQLLLNSYNQSETNVTGSFTIPTGMNRLYLFGCGGGGGGGLVTSQDNGCGAGGGGAANISGNYITVSGGQVYNYQIGARGNANGGGGGTTSVTLNGGSAVMTLAGGGGGGNSGGSGGGSGGSASGLAGGVSGGNGGVGGIRNNRSGGSGDSVTNGCGGGGGGGGHVSPQGGGTGGTATVSVGTFTKGSITISFAGVAGGSPGSTGAGQQLAPNVLDSLGGGGNGQDGNTGQGGGAGGGIRPTVNGTAYPRYYGGGGGGNRSYISGGTASDGRNSGSGAGGFLIAVATQNV